MALTTITVRVAAATQSFSDDMSAAFSGATVKVETFEKDFQESADRMNATAVFLGNVFSNLASTIGHAFESLLGALKGFGEEAVSTSAKYNTALLALINTTRAFGQSSTDAIAAAQGLSSKGLLPIGDAARGLRNLLVTGFGLKEATDIMNVFQDTAVNARKSTYDFNDAVVAGTEGLRTGQARLVTATGVTKNFGVELKQAGLTMQDLTIASKASAAQQAIYTGIMREGAAAAGDAARAHNTYSGAMIALNASYKSALAQVGDFITRNQSIVIVLRAVGDMLRQNTDNLQNNKKAYDLVSESLILAAKSLSLLLQGVDYVQTAAFGLIITWDKLSIAIAKGLNVVLGAVTKLSSIASLGAFTFFNPELAADFQKAGELATAAIKDLAVGIAGVQADIEKNTATNIKWGNAIQGVKASADALSKELDASKGHILALDAGARTGADGMDRFSASQKDLAKAAAAAAKLLKEEQKAIDSLDEKVKIYMGQRFGIPVKLTLPPEDQLNVLLGKLDQELAAKTKSGDVPQLGFKVKLTIPDEFNNDLQQTLIDFSTEIGKKLESVFKNASIPIGTALEDAIGTSISDAFGKELKKILDEAAKAGRQLTAQETDFAYLAIGAEAGIAGLQIGQTTGSKSRGVIGGAATGALAGLPLAGPTLGISVGVGAAAGALGGLIGGIIGGQSKFDQAMNDLRAAKEALITQAGGLDKLKAEADAVGVSFDAIYNATNVNDFNAAVTKLNTALADQQANVTALGTAMDAINARAADFAQPFNDLLAAQQKAQAAGDTTGADAASKQLMADAQAGQAEFERLGLYVSDAFAGIVKNGGSAIDALTKMAPAFQTLQDGVEKFGLTSNKTIDSLISDFKLVNDATFKPLFQQIQDTGTILTSLMSANALSPDTFQAAAADIGASIQTIIDKGGNAAATLALSQPVLQSLWEAQQKYGTITDDTTKSILDQAEQQGLVGENMKSVNEKILDVLVAIGKVLGADLPKDFDNLGIAAQSTANDIETSFNTIHINPIKIVYDGEPPPQPYTPPDTGTGNGGGGAGGTTPAALMAVRTQAAVNPLFGSALGLTGGGGTAILEVDKKTLAEMVVPAMPGVIKRYGLGGSSR